MLGSQSLLGITSNRLAVVNAGVKNMCYDVFVSQSAVVYLTLEC